MAENYLSLNTDYSKISTYLDFSLLKTTINDRKNKNDVKECSLFEKISNGIKPFSEIIRERQNETKISNMFPFLFQ